VALTKEACTLINPDLPIYDVRAPRPAHASRTCPPRAACLCSNQRVFVRPLLQGRMWAACARCTQPVSALKTRSPCGRSGKGACGASAPALAPAGHRPGLPLPRLVRARLAAWSRCTPCRARRCCTARAAAHGAAALHFLLLLLAAP